MLVKLEINDIPKEVMEEMRNAWGELDFSSYGDRLPLDCSSFKLERVEQQNVEADIPCLETGGHRSANTEIVCGYYVRARISEGTAQIYRIEFSRYFKESEGERE